MYKRTKIAFKKVISSLGEGEQNIQMFKKYDVPCFMKPGGT